MAGLLRTILPCLPLGADERRIKFSSKEGQDASEESKSAEHHYFHRYNDRVVPPMRLTEKLGGDTMQYYHTH